MPLLIPFEEFRTATTVDSVVENTFPNGGCGVVDDDEGVQTLSSVPAQCWHRAHTIMFKQVEI